jgi:hypothetical protein
LRAALAGGPRDSPEHDVQYCDITSEMTADMKTASARLGLRAIAPQWNGASARLALRRHGVPLGLALVAGAALRLVWLGDTSFLGDQSELLALGRSAADHHAFILTGILSSIGTLNPPISAWLYAPFALLGGPQGATFFTALVNILAIGLLYAVTTRYGSRRAGFTAALLYATASGPVHYSRFIWQQNLMAPALILLLGAILAGLVEHKRGWLGWAALWWGVALQLHPTTAALLTVFALAIVLTWRELRLRDAAWALGALAVLYLPSLIWEIASHGADLTAFTNLSGGQNAITDAVVFGDYSALITPAAFDAYGAGSGYAAVGAALQPLGVLVIALALIAGVWLTIIAVSPWLRRARPAGMEGGWLPVIGSPRWRLAATLLIWQLTPVLLLLHHSRKVPEHYLLILLPVVYITIGLWAASASRWIERRLGARWGMTAGWGLVALTLALALAQTVGVVAEINTVHSGAFSGLALPLHYGIPLSAERQTFADAETAARRAGASLAIASTAVQQEPYGYLARTAGAPATVYVSDGCVLTPSATSARPLVALSLPSTLAARALPVMSGAQRIGTLPAQGSQPLTLYRLAPGAGPSNETRPVPPSASGPTLAGYSLAQDARGASYLTLRWANAPALTQRASQRASYWFGAAPGGPTLANYTISAQRLDAAGKPLGAPLKASCDRLAWEPGADILAWLPLPLGPSSGHAIWRVMVSVAPLVASRPQIGPLALETGNVTFSAPHALAGPTTITV